MKSLNDCMAVYKQEIKKGDIKHAYSGLMDFFKSLQKYFQYDCLAFSVTSNIYYGCMDLTFISFSTELLKRKKLKVAIVFIHDKFQFEVWLAGTNKNIQQKYLKQFKEQNWTEYNLASSTDNATYISNSIIVEEPDFSNLDTLTKTIENNVVEFIASTEKFISKH